MLDLEYRKLAAIMITDMAGYSDFSRRDEEGALHALDLYRRIVRDAVASHAGTEVKTMGDGFLLEFPSALDAVRCAVQIQHRLRDLNAQREQSEPIGVRIGVHLGEVIHKEDDILGDGVNIAYRIEPLAEPGGIWLSEDVARQVESKIPWPLRRLGTAELTGPSILIGIYRVVLPWEAPTPSGAEAPGGHRCPWPILSLVAVCLILAVIAGALWVTRGRRDRAPVPVATALQSPTESAAPSAAPPAGSASSSAPRSAVPEAHREYLAGRQVWADSAEPGGSPEAAAHFAEATHKDPGFAEAWAALARCYALMGAYGQKAPGDAFPQARAAAEKALSLDPKSAEAMVALALAVACHGGDWNQADVLMRKAALEASGSAIVTDAMMYWLALRGDTLGSSGMLAEAQRLDPVNRPLPLNACYVALAMGSPHALNLASTLASQANPSPQALLMLARAQWAAGNPVDASATLARVPRQVPLPPSFAVLSFLVGAPGSDAASVRQTLAALEQRADGGEYVSAALVAACHAVAGNRPQAQAWLERARTEGSIELRFASTWPELGPIRGDPALAPLLPDAAGGSGGPGMMGH